MNKMPKKNLCKNITINLLIFRKIVKKLIILCLLFFTTILHANTRECRFLDRINCTDCPAPLKVDCGGEIKYIKPSTQFPSVNALLQPIGSERGERVIKSIYGPKFADSFVDNAPKFTLKSPSGTANDFTNNIGENIIYGNQANPEEEPFANNSIGWIIKKIKIRTQPPEIIKQYGEEYIARASIGLIHSRDEIYMSYNIDDQDLYQNPNGNHEGEVQDNFCWYSSVPQVVGVNSSEDRQKCSIKFCSADVKCKVGNTLVNHKAFCNATGTNYDKCPKAVDCMNRKNISVNNPSNWESYINGQEIEKTPVTEEEEIAWNEYKKKGRELNNIDLAERPREFWRKYQEARDQYDNAKAKYEKGIISEDAVRQAWNEVEQSFQQVSIAGKEHERKRKLVFRELYEARMNHFDTRRKRILMDESKEPTYFPPGS